MPNLNVWAEDPLTCSATLKGTSFDKTKEVFFVFHEGSKELAKVKASLEKSGGGTVATCKWDKAAAPEKGAAWRLVNYYLKVDGTDHRNFAQDIYVWAKEVTVTARTKDDKPFPNAVCKIIQKPLDAQGKPGAPFSVERKLDDQGKLTHRLAHPTDFEVAWVYPFYLEDGKWLKDEGIAWEAKIRKSEVNAELVFPSDADHKQWVNLPRSKEPSEGSKIKIKVRAVSKDKLPPDAEVFIEVAADAKNSDRTDAAPPKGGTYKNKARVNSSGEAEFELELGAAGGNKYTVKVGGSPEVKDKSCTITTWRQLYYQVSRPKGFTAPAVTDLVDGLAKVMAKSDPHDEQEIPVDDGPAGSWVDGEDVGIGAGKKLIIGGHNRDYFHSTYFKAKKKPVDLHFLFCHLQIDANPAESATLTVNPGNKIDFPGDSAKVEGASALGSAIVSAKLYPTDLTNGKPSVKATWESLAASGKHHGKTGDVPADHIVVNYKDHKADNGKVSIKLPPAAAAVVKDGEKVKLLLTCAVATGTYNGESDNHKLLIRADRPDSSGNTDVKGINGTMLHELGHAIQMVLDDTYSVSGIVKPRDTHGRWYQRRGHQGDHCAKDVSQAIYDDASQTMKGREGNCVMFGEGWSGRPVAYCDLCTPFVLAIDLSSVTK